MASAKKSAGKAVVRCKDYNGHPNVLFMMKANDFRYGTADYEVVAPPDACRYDHKAKTLTANGVTYRVYADWSLKAVRGVPIPRQLATTADLSGG